MGLPFQPEPAEALAERFKASIERVYDAEMIANGKSDRPGEHRENIFDFEDGFRIIISKEKANGCLFLHASISHQEGNVPNAVLLTTVVSRLMALRNAPMNGPVQISYSKSILHLIQKIGPEWVERAIISDNPTLN